MHVEYTEDFGHTVPTEKNQGRWKMQRKVKVVLGRRKTKCSHDKWGFPIHVNNLANVDSWTPKQLNLD